MRCPNCGAKNKKTRDYCKDCGSRLPKPYEWDDFPPFAAEDSDESPVLSRFYDDEPVIEELVEHKAAEPDASSLLPGIDPDLLARAVAVYEAQLAAKAAEEADEEPKAKRKKKEAKHADGDDVPEEDGLAEDGDGDDDTEGAGEVEAEVGGAPEADAAEAAEPAEEADGGAGAADGAEALAEAAAGAAAAAAGAAVADAAAETAAASAAAEAAKAAAEAAEPKAAPAAEPEPKPEPKQPAKPAKKTPKQKPKQKPKKRGVGRIVLTVFLLLVLAAAVAVAALGRGLSSDTVLGAFNEQLSSIYPTIGLYDNDGTFEAGEVSVVSVTAPAADEQGNLPAFAQSALERLQGVLGFEGDARTATVQAIASNGSVEVQGTYEADFVKEGGAWVAQGGFTPTDVSYRALTGPSDAKVVANIGSILVQGRNAEGTSLDLLYSGYEASVAGHSLDVRGDADTVTIHLVRDGAYLSAEADLLCNFVLVDGSWQVESIVVGQADGGIDYQRFIGTWSGMYVDDVTYSAHCYAGRVQPLTVTISAVDPNTHVATGTFSGLLHDHMALEADSEWTEGDTAVYDVPFEAPFLTDATYNPEQTAMSTPVVGLSYDVQDANGHWIRLVLGFGTQTDENATIASLTTYFTVPEYPDNYIPFTDRYMLSRVG